MCVAYTSVCNSSGNVDTSVYAVPAIVVVIIIAVEEPSVQLLHVLRPSHATCIYVFSTLSSMISVSTLPKNGASLTASRCLHCIVYNTNKAESAETM